MMHGQALARVIVGIVGNVISLLLFLSPAPTIKTIWRNKFTGEFHPFLYLASLMNCLFWVFYGLPAVHPDSILVLSINSAGLLLEAIYLFIFFWYTDKRKRVIILGFIAGEMVLLATVGAVTLFCYETHESRSKFVGIICVVCGIVMYASPLSVIGQVIQSQNPESMPFLICLAGFGNGAIWCSYAFLKEFDPYLAVANGLGTAFGLFQLSVHAALRFKASRISSVHSEVKHAEIMA